MDINHDLESAFAGYRSPDQAASWATAKSHLPLGTTVSGVVIARYPFGAFVDIGVGFPALLEIILMDAPVAERGQSYPVGSSVTAFIGGFRDDARQIGLWQIMPEWMSSRPTQNEWRH